VLNEEEEEIKYFVSNASAEEPLDHLLLAAFSRWRVERSFQDTKQKLGLGDYEGRCYTGLLRHLLLCSLSYYFLQRSWLSLSKKRGVDVFSGFACGGGGVDAVPERDSCIADECLLSGSQRFSDVLPSLYQTQTNGSSRP